MKWIIEGSEYTNLEEAAEASLEEIGDESYNEILDEEGTAYVGGHEFYPSEILSKLDPIAYRCGKNDWTDGLREGVEKDLQGMSEGEKITIYGVDVRCYEGEEEEE